MHRPKEFTSADQVERHGANARGVWGCDHTAHVLIAATAVGHDHGEGTVPIA